ncbi:MAG: hypothetical protein U0441_26915 [Polyangiaceae bacterium]
MKRISLGLSCAALVLAASGCGLTEKFPDRAVFVANGGSSSISVIDPATGKVTDEIPIAAGFHPHHLALSPDGTRLAVAAPSMDLSMGHSGAHGSGATSKIYVFDSSSGTQIAEADVDATVHNVAFLDFQTVAYAMMEHGMIVGASASDLKEKWTASVGMDPLEVTRISDDRALVANSGDDTVSIVDTALHTQLDAADVGGGPIAVWNTPAGLFISLETDKKVAVLSSGNLKDVTSTYDVGGVPGQVTSNAKGDAVWIAVEDRGVVEMRDPSNGKVVWTSDLGGKPHGLVIDDDAGLGYVTDEGASRVVRAKTSDGSLVDVIEVGDAPNGIVQRGL